MFGLRSFVLSLIGKFVSANHPSLIGIVPIFEFENLKKSGHPDFQEENKKTFSFVKIWNCLVKDWS